MTTFTRQQIEAIEVGTTVAGFYPSEFTPVVSIHAKKEDIHGKLFVCGYRQCGDNAQISFSVKEGEEVGKFITVGA